MRRPGPSDEIFRMRYSEAKHLKADDAPAALLLATVLYGLYDVEAPQVATVKPVGDLAASPSIRARVLKDSWCHAEVYAAARSKPAFRQV